MLEVYTFLIAAPKSFGKMTVSENGKEPCPCLFIHHGLMDGLHLGQ
jgi:hypothetical protein